MKILVSGGAGFIGSHVVEALLADSHEVAVIDNLSSGSQKNLPEKIAFYQCDVTDHLAVRKIFSEVQPEVVYHLAAQIDIRKSMIDPISDAQNNVVASLNLMQCAKEQRIKKFIFSSSAGVYGDTSEIPTPETAHTYPPSVYGVSKLATEKYLYTYAHSYGISYTVLRYANVYGPRQTSFGEAGVVATFFNRMSKGENPIIFGDGQQTRDFVFVTDVAQANLAALSSSLSDIYNVGTGKETSIRELFREINRFFGNQFFESYGPEKKGEQIRSALEASKIQKSLGWLPRVSLQEGLARTHEWFANRKKA